MSLIVACPNCQTRYNLPDKFKGKKLKCKSCGKPFAATVGATQAKATHANQVAPQQQAVDPQELSKMGIAAIPQQQDPFAAQPQLGPDPLRNHVVQDPGFAMPGQGGVPSMNDGDDPDVDSDFAAVTSNPFINTLPTTPNKSNNSSNSPNKKSPRRLKDASFGKRLGGNFVDGIFINIVASGGFFLAGLFAESIPVLAIILVVLTMLFLVSYFFLFEGISGRTVGKYVTGTKVVSEDGGKASFVQIIGRTFCRLIPFEIFSFLFYEDKSRPVFWHDALPKTRVVEL